MENLNDFHSINQRIRRLSTLDTRYFLPEERTLSDFLTLINRLSKQVNFFDEQLEERGDWFDFFISNELFLLAEIEKSPRVIFTTAYDEFALKAFEVNALDYLLKPIDPKRLTDAIQKLQSEIALEQASLLGVNRGPLTEVDQVFVKDGERCWFVKLAEIRLFESVGNYAKVYFSSNKPLILKSLNALEERLDDRVFFRANRKHIINLHWIEKIEPYFNGGLLVELKGGEKIEISRRQTVKFKEMMSF